MTTAPTSEDRPGDSRPGALAASTGKLFWDVVSRSLSFALSVLLARRLGAAGLGVFAVAWYAAWMASQATDLGLHLAGLRALSRRFRPRRLASLVLCKAALTVLAFAAFALVAASGSLGADAVLLLVLLLAHLAGSWVELTGVALRSRGRVAREGLLLVSLRAGWLLAAVWALTGLTGLTETTRSLDLRELALALAAASLPALAVALGISARLLGRDIELPSLSEVLGLARTAIPLSVVSVLTLVYLRADLFLLAAMRDAREVGLFAASFRLFEATFVLSGGLVAGAFPLLARGARRGTASEPAHLVLALLVALAVPVTFVLTGTAEPVLGLLFGETFRPAAPVLTWLGCAVPAVYVNALTTHLLFAAGRSRVLVGVIVLRLAVGVALDVLWIPARGAEGAALAVCVAEWSLTAASVFATRDWLRRRTFLGEGLRRIARARAGAGAMVPVSSSHSGAARRP